MAAVPAINSPQRANGTMTKSPQLLADAVALARKRELGHTQSAPSWGPISSYKPLRHYRGGTMIQTLVRLYVLLQLQYFLARYVFCTGREYRQQLGYMGRGAWRTKRKLGGNNKNPPLRETVEFSAQGMPFRGTNGDVVSAQKMESGIFQTPGKDDAYCWSLNISLDSLRVSFVRPGTFTTNDNQTDNTDTNSTTSSPTSPQIRQSQPHFEERTKMLLPLENARDISRIPRKRVLLQPQHFSWLATRSVWDVHEGKQKDKDKLTKCQTSQINKCQTSQINKCQTSQIYPIYRLFGRQLQEELQGDSMPLRDMDEDVVPAQKTGEEFFRHRGSHTYCWSSTFLWLATCLAHSVWNVRDRVNTMTQQE